MSPPSGCWAKHPRKKNIACFKDQGHPGPHQGPAGYRWTEPAPPEAPQRVDG